MLGFFTKNNKSSDPQDKTNDNLINYRNFILVGGLLILGGIVLIKRL